MSTLNEESGFNKLITLYKQNQDKPWFKWLEVQNVFQKSGKQGLVGTMNVIGNKDTTFVFKISQYINYLVRHEFAVMKSLNNLSDYCPHFCKAIGGIICEVDPTVRKKGNPFISQSEHLIEKEVLLMENLVNTRKFYSHIYSNLDEKCLYSTIKQILLAITIAQRKVKLTHYDLHSNNIMMRQCNKDVVFLYILDEDNQFCVASNGYCPVIIDYGFSYSDGLKNGPLWPSLGHTEVGFMSDRFDPIADPKLFLVTVAGEIKEARGTKQSKKLWNIVKNNYGPLPLDWSSGWDKGIDKSSSEYVTKIFKKFKTDSNLFEDYDHYCIDILQSLIILPLQKQNYKNIETSYKTFIKEFSKIENEIGTPFYCMYILKGIVDAARVVRKDYIQKSSRKHAIDYFKVSTFEYIDSVVKFCKPKNIHFERMLCSLLCLGREIEGILYSKTEKRMREKIENYNNVPLQTPEEVCAVIDINIPDEYVFNTNTTIMAFDAINEKCVPFCLTKDEINDINNVASISRGSELYQIYQKI